MSRKNKSKTNNSTTNTIIDESESVYKSDSILYKPKNVYKSEFVKYIDKSNIEPMEINVKLCPYVGITYRQTTYYRF